RVLRVPRVRDGVPGHEARRGPGPQALRRADGGRAAPPRRPTGAELALSDLLSLVPEGAELLPRPPIVGDQLVGPGESPAAEAHADPAVDPAKLAAALRARTGGPGAHGLDLIEAVPAGPADVLVDRHVHRVSTAPCTGG